MGKLGSCPGPRALGGALWRAPRLHVMTFFWFSQLTSFWAEIIGHLRACDLFFLSSLDFGRTNGHIKACDIFLLFS